MSSEESIVRKSVTRLGTRLRELEETADQPGSADHVAQLVARLDGLESEFKSIHFQVIDAEDEKSLDKEQEYLDKYDDDLTSIKVRLCRLLAAKSDTPASSVYRKTLSCKLSRLEKSLRVAEEALSEMTGELDISLLELYREQLAGYKKDLANVCEDLLAIDLPDTDDLFDLHAQLERVHFECSHKVKKLLMSSASGTPPTPAVDGKGVKLPKLDVPTFDGVLSWRQFWEQFVVSVHDRNNLSDAEKLVYLQHANTVEWLEEFVTKLAEESCEAVREDIHERGDAAQWVASYDGYYKTGKIAWFVHRTKRGSSHNWEGTSAGAEGDMFDEVLKKAKNANFNVKEIVTDKDSSVKSIYLQHFPEGIVTFCSNHCSKTFHKDLQKIKQEKCQV